MIEVDMQHDLEQAAKEVGDFFWRELPFGLSQSMNATAKDVQRHLRGVTIPKAWTGRNAALPKAMTGFIPHPENPAGGLTNARQNRWSIMIGPSRSKTGYLAGEGFSERQVTGKTKTPKGSAVAIPQIGPGLKRLKGGSIPSKKKPKNLRGNKKFFTKGNVLYERMGAKGKKIKPRYVLAKQAVGTKKLARFYPDAFYVTDKVFSGHFNTSMNRAIRTSRFFPGR